MPWARPLARDNAGNNIADRMPIMAITTSNSIRVNPTPFAPPANAEVGETGNVFTAQKLLTIHLVIV